MEKMVNASRWSNTLQDISRNLIELVFICSMLIVLGIMIVAGYEIDSLLSSLSAFVMAAVKLLKTMVIIAHRLTTIEGCDICTM
ncbi:hypothetical protein D7V86_08530 [bacterium D16-51]|nr:hypothetical protein D7V96_08515 [bacterium D16-59]RKI60635.1 hypothetical protein D7V86_08530 [bacterium D16-51]